MAKDRTPNYRFVDTCWNCAHSRYFFAWEDSTLDCTLRKKSDSTVQESAICDRWKLRKKGGA
jgi:hypothetical protein